MEKKLSESDIKRGQIGKPENDAFFPSIGSTITIICDNETFSAKIGKTYITGFKECHQKHKARKDTVISIEKKEENKYNLRYHSSTLKSGIDKGKTEKTSDVSQEDGNHTSNSDASAKKWFLNYILNELEIKTGEKWEKLVLKKGEKDGVTADVKICKVKDRSIRRYYELKSQNSVNRNGEVITEYFGGVSLSEIEGAIKHPDSYQFVFIRRRDNSSSKYLNPRFMTLQDLIECLGTTIQVNFKFNLTVKIEKDNVIISPKAKKETNGNDNITQKSLEKLSQYIHRLKNELRNEHP